MGTHHGINPKYLKSYLGEYVYRFNRRHDPERLFSRALKACLSSSPRKTVNICQTLPALSGYWQFSQAKSMYNNQVRIKQLSLFSLTILELSFSLVLPANAKVKSEIELLSEILEKEIDTSDFSAVDQLTENERITEQNATREQYFSERKKPWSPVPYRALLLQGTRLVDIKTGKVFFSSIDLYVLAQEETVGSQEAFVLNQDKVAIYRTYTKNLKSIEADISLYPNVDPSENYNLKDKHHSVDSIIQIESHLTFHAETMDNDYFANLYGGTETIYTANRFQSKTYYKSKLPIDFGLSLGFQEGLWNETNKRIKWNSGSFGPSLRWKMLKWEKLKLNTKFGVERSFNFKAVGEESQSTFSSLLYEFEVEAEYASYIGAILVGASLRNMSWQLEDSNDISGFTDNQQQVSSYSLFVGYKVNVQL